MLGLSESGGEYFRFKPSINAWIVDGDEIDFKGMGIDPESLKTGWGKIQEGAAPEWVWDERPGVKSRAPDADFKRGFSLMVFIKDVGWREWTTTGSGPKMGLEAVWPAIHNSKNSNPGKMAMVAFKGAKAVSVGKGQTRVPEFELAGWKDKPEETAAPAPAPEPEPVAAAPQAVAEDSGDWEF